MISGVRSGMPDAELRGLLYAAVSDPDANMAAPELGFIESAFPRRLTKYKLP